MTAMHPITLSFTDGEMEAAYISSSLARDRAQGRTAIIVGVFVYLIYGLLDTLFVPVAERSAIWTIRLCALNVPLFVYLASYTRHFEKYRHALLASVGLAAGIGLISMLSILTVQSAVNFYPGLVLAPSIRTTSSAPASSMRSASICRFSSLTTSCSASSSTIRPWCSPATTFSSYRPT